MEEKFYLGWGTLALINAILAQIKNEMNGGEDFGGVFWFILSLVIGPLATFFLIFKECKLKKD